MTMRSNKNTTINLSNAAIPKTAVLAKQRDKHRPDKCYAIALKEMRKKLPDLDKVKALLLEAINSGSGEATYALATWYLFGKEPIVKRNLLTAIKLLPQSAERGISDAMFDLAVSYETGVGVKRSPAVAYNYYLMAALRGNAAAVFEVGRCLDDGIGVDRDHKRAANRPAPCDAPNYIAIP